MAVLTTPRRNAGIRQPSACQKYTATQTSTKIDPYGRMPSNTSIARSVASSFLSTNITWAIIAVLAAEMMK